MGDLIELTTWPKHLNSFYKITSNALAFEIKGYGNALIGLSRKPGFCDYLITIGEHQHCWIRWANGSNQESANTPGILTTEEYRKFWVTWNNGRVQLGREGYSDAIVSCKNDLQNIKYFTVSVLENRNPVHWRFQTPPAFEQVQDKEIYGCDLHWVRYTPGEEFPEEPFVGGYEKEKLYIARAGHRGSVTPGKFVPSAGNAYISWGGQANEKTDVEILCGFAGFWVPTSEDRIPVEAFSAGYSEDCHERLYIGRAEHDGHLIPGKVQPSHQVCYFSYQGREVATKNYEILVLKRTGKYFNKIKHPSNRIMLRQYMHPQIDEYDIPPSDSSDEMDED